MDDSICFLNEVGFQDRGRIGNAHFARQLCHWNFCHFKDQYS